MNQSSIHLHLFRPLSLRPLSFSRRHHLRCPLVLPRCTPPRPPNVSSSRSTSTLIIQNILPEKDHKSPSLLEIEKKVHQLFSNNRPSFTPFEFDPYTLNHVSTPLDERISAAKGVEALLHISTESNLALKHACGIILSLSTLTDPSKGAPAAKLTDFEGDERFIRLCALIKNGDYSQNPRFAIKVLQGLQKLGIPPDSDLHRSLENELKWSFRKCPIKFLCKSIEYLSMEGVSGGLKLSLSNEASCELETDVLSTAVGSMQRRWVEVSSGSDFIFAFKVIHHLNGETKGKIEDRAIDECRNFTMLEIIKIFSILSSQKVRPTPLLRAMAFHWAKSDEEHSSRDLVEFLNALNELSFTDPVLLEKLVNDITQQIPKLKNQSLMTLLVTCIGQLRYNKRELSNAIEVWLMENLENLKSSDVAAWLMTCSVLNYRSEHLGAFVKRAKMVLDLPHSSNPAELVHLTFALATLDLASREDLATALRPPIVAKIDDPNLKNVGLKIKLLSLNALARSDKTYHGPSLEPGLVERWTDASVGTSDAPLTKVLHETLSHFIPPPKYLITNVKRPSGIFVDAVCCLSDKGELSPLPSDWDKNPQVRRVAFLTLGYGSNTIGSTKDPLGSRLLAKSLLERENFHVIFVPYYEFHGKGKLIGRIQYLEEKLKGIASSLHLLKKAASPPPNKSPTLRKNKKSNKITSTSI